VLSKSTSYIWLYVPGKWEIGKSIALGSCNCSFYVVVSAVLRIHYEVVTFLSLGDDKKYGIWGEGKRKC